jgi:protein SCO1
MRKHRPFSYLIAITIISLVTYRYFSSPSLEETEIKATLLPVPRLIADVELTDQDGESFRTLEWSDKWKLVFFGFTRCPDICPAAMAYLAKEFDTLGSEQYEVWLISVDPERDDPDTLREYVANFHPSFRAATGAQEDIDLLLSSMGSTSAKVEHNHEHNHEHHHDYTVSHSPDIFIVSPHAEWVGVYRQMLPKGEIAVDLKSVQEKSKSRM